MSLTRVSTDGNEPVGLQEAKDHCYVTGSKWDELLESLITAAREYAENETWRAIVDATFECRLDEFDGEIEIPKPPIKSIEKIAYIDTDGSEVELASSEYDADVSGEYGRIQPVKKWPETDDTYNAVTITFKAGYDTVPEQIKKSLLLFVKHLFENRESVVVGNSGTLSAMEVPMTTDLLLSHYSARNFV